MSWRPTRLTREQLEERRLEGARLLKAGQKMHAAIARQLGVSRAAVSQWAKTLDAKGVRGLRRRVGSGVPGRLTAQDKQLLKRLLRRGARAAGFETERWTLARVRQLIQREFEVTYHPHHVSKVLKQLEWSLQQPLPRAVERDEDVIRAWLAHDWPRIKKGAAAWRRRRAVR